MGDWTECKAWINENRLCPIYAVELLPGLIYCCSDKPGGELTATAPFDTTVTWAWVKDGSIIIRTAENTFRRLDDMSDWATLAKAQGLDDLTDISDDALVAELRRRGRLRRVRATQEIDHYYLDGARFNARLAINREVRQMLAEEIPAHETSERGKDRTTFSAELEVLL